MVRRWTGLTVSIWVLVSPWILGFSDISLAKWGNVIAGTVLVLRYVWEIFGEEGGETQQTERTHS